MSHALIRIVAILTAACLVFLATTAQADHSEIYDRSHNDVPDDTSGYRMTPG